MRVTFIKPFLANFHDLKGKEDKWINHLLLIYKNHVSFGKEIADLVSLFFNKEINNNEFPSDLAKKTIETVIKGFKEEIININKWNVECINMAINNTKEKTGIKGKELYMPIRIKVSGEVHGPELPDTIYLLGKDTILDRLSK